jgi:hypothetical protein
VEKNMSYTRNQTWVVVEPNKSNKIGKVAFGVHDAAPTDGLGIKENKFLCDYNSFYEEVVKIFKWKKLVGLVKLLTHHQNRPTGFQGQERYLSRRMYHSIIHQQTDRQ